MLAVPSLVVLVSLAQPAQEVWAHLWRTQLLELIGNTLALLAGVGAGTLVVGTGLAWLVVAYSFPGRGVLEWALVLPLAMPAYVIGFAFLGLFDFAGPVQGALRRWLGDGVRLPEIRSYWGVVVLMTLVFYPYVYLLARAGIARELDVPALSRGDFPELRQFGVGLDESTPLWYYVLREAQIMANGLTLGPVGGRIVGEVFIGLLQLDRDSYLSQRGWRPTLPTRSGRVTGDFRMVDFLAFARVDPAHRGR